MRTHIQFQPKGKKVTIRKGENLLQAGLKNRVYIKSRCGGKGSCTACKIQILSDNPLVSLPTTQEMRMLGEENVAKGYRLACQTRIYGEVEVLIPEETWKTKVKNQLEETNEETEGN